MRRIVVAAGFIGLVAGCGGKVVAQSEDDAGVDASVVDSGVVVIDGGVRDTRPEPRLDTGIKPEVGPPVCDQDLPKDFACAPPTAKEKGGPPSTACTEAELADMVKECIGPDYKVLPGCSTWKTAHPACNACVESFAFEPVIIPGKAYPDRDKCFYWVLDDRCATAMRCMLACDDAVCADCDPTPGTGTVARASEFGDCIARERNRGGTTSPKGRCYDLAAKDGLACFAAASDALTPCIVSEFFAPTGTGGHPDVDLMREGILQYYRGACRDAGDWSKSTSP